MNTKYKNSRMFANILSIVVMLAMAFPAIGSVSAEGEEPGLRAFPDQDRADGMFWPAGELVYLTINGSSYGSQAADNNGYVDFPLAGFDLQRGDILTMISGDISVTHTARQLFVDNINLDAQSISGTVDGGQQTVHVWTGDTQLYVDSDVDGNWSADFSGAADPVLFQGACGNVEAWEGQGSTIIDWCLPPPPPTPFFQVQLETNHVDGWNWKPNAQVTISISGAEAARVPTDEWGTFRSHFGDLEPFTPGMDFFITDGVSDKTLTTAYLEITNVDPDADTVSGKATAGQTFNVWVHGPENAPTVQVTTDHMGQWTADFSEQWNIIPGNDGAAQIDDEDGDGTWVPWRLPNPRFTVFPEWEWFDGNDWPNGATVTITVAGKPECETTKQSWGYFFNGNFGEGCDIQFGDTVTFTDGATSRMHIVQKLYVTDVDMATNTVSGKADAGVTVFVWPHDGWFEPLQATATDLGEWQVDLDDAGYTIRDDSAGRSEIRDAMGNATASDWHVLHPRMVVFPEWEWFDGNDWPNEATVTITVAGKPECETTKESWNYFFNGNFGEGCDIVVGDEVTFTYGDIVRTHTVRNLAITKVNQEDNIVKGTADEGAEVHVWPHATGQEQLAITNPQGKWNVDFTGIYEIMLGDGGRAEIRDEMGNATAVDWYIPRPRIVASITEDWFYLQEFSPDKILDFTVYEAQGGKPIWKGTATTDGSGFAWIDSEGRWNLEPGNYLLVRDGQNTKDLIIEDFTFDLFDLANGHLEGTAPEPFGRTVWVGIGFENDGWSMEVFTDPDGNWAADFDTPVPSNYQWVAAQIFDGDGDASELRPDQVINLWVAAYTYDLPVGSLTDGTYPYHFEFEWDVPESGSWSGQGGELAISSAVEVYDGYVLLRGPEELRGIATPEGLACEGVGEINPNQPMRFLVGWLMDSPMTYEEAQAHFQSIDARVVWGEGDDEMSAELAPHEIIPFSWDDLNAWFNYVCTFTADLILSNQPDWVNSGITVSAGQSFTIEAFGLMNPCSDTYPNGPDFCIFYTPEGAEGVVPYENEFGIFPGPGLRFMALLGRIGDGAPFYIGAGGTFTAEQDGTLWFTPNDNLRTDNQGVYGVLVCLEP